MKKYLVIPFMLLTLCSFVANAQTWQGNRWTNGSEMLVCEQLNNTQVLFLGGGFFDAGYGYLFNIKKIGAGSYDLIGAPKPLTMPKDKNSLAYNVLSGGSFNGETNCRWKRKEVRGMDILLCYDQEGKLTSIYSQTSLDLREHAQDKITEMFAGVYKDEQGRRYSFASGDGTCVWAGKNSHFSICHTLGAPQYCIEVNGKLYNLELTMKGLDIYEAEPVDEEQYFKNVRLVASLTVDKTMPRFADTSVYPCDSYAISMLDRNIIRLIRNEIYARKGWVFKDAQLNKYFRSLPWYKPSGDNSKIKLNEMELLNVSLLKYYEDINN